MLFSRAAYRLSVAATWAGLAQAASIYAIADVFDSKNFFTEFDFFSQADPTNGFVKYVDAATANREGLAGFAKGGVYLGVDYKNTTDTGRSSVRVTSKKAYTKGLFIADIAHMPASSTNTGSCGLWPAFWMFGPNWPNSGEIDILEGVNTQANNSITLHTSGNCRMTNRGSLSGTKLANADCFGNLGCKQDTAVANTYGASFNAAGGGVYALEWTDEAISVWFFTRGSSMATSLSRGANNSVPGTSHFGQPLATFVGGSGCSIDGHFKDHNIVLNTAFCGDWAGKVWSDDETCSALASTCEEYVGSNPSEFTQAYWLLNSIKVYQQGATIPKRRERKGLRFAA
ncbi:concanavalin A-like lectin/glucanase domain-containing protein [Lasiosphaeris hirsuta]|uniref:endo-1,3(4)-beta-glucanase n=1 Tax=Lasiosphaeris hirsuta TaxID=260670 RepID=A0AA40E9Y1_9PEZI|nr:concanavalin A-like lectin/glucanase domain-containing protein [Lasiosphaeris hirsuta]